MTFKEIATENGDNWSVFYFECPVNKLKEVLVDLFQHLREIKEAKLPHFLCREYVLTRHVGISLRVLRKKDDATILNDKLVEFFEKQKLQYEQKPGGNRHAWTREGAIDPSWNEKRCIALNQLSNFVVFLAENDLFDTNTRCFNAHYLINMLVLKEATVFNRNLVCLLDIITGKVLSFPTQQLKQTDF